MCLGSIGKLNFGSLMIHVPGPYIAIVKLNFHLLMVGGHLYVGVSTQSSYHIIFT